MTRPAVWRLRRRTLGPARTGLMGIVNVTDDSFSDGGRFRRADAAIAHARRLVDDGADIIDIGGESTRPGADPVPAEEELARVLPVVEEVASWGVPVSIDTSKAVVAEAALARGAEIVNDVTAFGDPDMAAVVAEGDAAVVLMHMRGNPRTMQDDPRYDDVVAEVVDHLRSRADVAMAAGVPADRIALDPGIGFGKTVEHNLRLLDELDALVALGHPVVVGTSRKSFLGALTGIEVPAERDVPTAATTVIAVERGATVVRVHDVAVNRAAARVADAIVASRGGRHTGAATGGGPRADRGADDGDGPRGSAREGPRDSAREGPRDGGKGASS